MNPLTAAFMGYAICMTCLYYQEVSKPALSEKQIGEIAHQSMNLIREKEAEWLAFNKKFTKISCETGYWDGQKDMMLGRVAIDTVNQVWLKSCWSADTVKPFDISYDPKLSIDENVKKLMLTPPPPTQK